MQSYHSLLMNYYEVWSYPTKPKCPPNLFALSMTYLHCHHSSNVDVDGRATDIDQAVLQFGMSPRSKFIFRQHLPRYFRCNKLAVESYFSLLEFQRLHESINDHLPRLACENG